MEKLKNEAFSMQKALSHHRRRLHSFAECSFELPKTIKYVKRTLRSMGYEPQDCGQGSVVCSIGDENGGGSVLLRADMDALPLREETRLSFRAENGNMHACGHDMHTAMLLGAATLLRAHEKELSHPVRLLFQGAEEKLLGARDACRAGVLAGVEAAFMIHVAPAVPYSTGTVLLPKAGAGAPAACNFTLEVFGKSAHGATPSEGCDALRAAAGIYEDALSFAERQDGRLIFTVGKWAGGHAHNIIAQHALLCGTFRSFDTDKMEEMKDKLLRLTADAKKKHGARAAVYFEGACPVLQNDGMLLRSMAALLDKMRFPNVSPPVAGGASEDFAVIAEQCPSLAVAIASGMRGHGYDIPLHHPSVLFDEDALPYGTALYTAFALQTFTKENGA